MFSAIVACSELEATRSMTDRTNPRLLAVSPIPPDLRAALAQRYELADHDLSDGGEAPRAGLRHRGDDGHAMASNARADGQRCRTSS